MLLPSSRTEFAEQELKAIFADPAQHLTNIEKGCLSKTGSGLSIEQYLSVACATVDQDVAVMMHEDREWTALALLYPFMVNN